MKVWTVWEFVDDYPENGGGEFLNKIFLNEDDANTYCNKMNKEEEEDEASWYSGEKSLISYFVVEWEAFEKGENAFTL